MSNASEIKGRLDQYLRAKGLSYPALESMAHLTNGYLRNNSGGYSAPKLSEIAEVCPDLNLNWLVTGIEPMLLPVAGGSLTLSGDIVSGNKVIVKKNRGGRNIEKVNSYYEGPKGTDFFDTHVSLAMIESADMDDVPKTLIGLITEIKQRKNDFDQLRKELEALRAKAEAAEAEAKKAKDELLDIYRKQVNIEQLK